MDHVPPDMSSGSAPSRPVDAVSGETDAFASGYECGVKKVIDIFLEEFLPLCDETNRPIIQELAARLRAGGISRKDITWANEQMDKLSQESTHGQ